MKIAGAASKHLGLQKGLNNTSSQCQRQIDFKLNVLKNKTFSPIQQSKRRAFVVANNTAPQTVKQPGVDDYYKKSPTNTTQDSYVIDVLPARKTKIVATIGPTSNTTESFNALADAGMNIVRLNMSHGDHTSHKHVVDLARAYNTNHGGNLAIMLDTKGPEVRSGDLVEPIDMKPGDIITFTIKEGADGTGGRVSVNYDEFPDDVSIGDTLLIDGGISSLLIESIENNTDVVCRVVDGGLLTSRRHLNCRGKSANLPPLTDRDWKDIEFGINMGVDYFALSFVRDGDVIYKLKEYLKQQGCTGTSSIGIIAKIESADSIKNLEDILDAADGAMVARGDLGAELPVEDVPILQECIIQGCQKRAKPCIVATHMLESMIQHPTPTRAEVADISVAVKESTDAIMLSGETAHGNHPLKAIEVMKTVARRTEIGMLSNSSFNGSSANDLLVASPSSAPKINWVTKQPGSSIPDITDLAALELSEVMAYHSVSMADTIKAPLVVFSRRGIMPALLSHFRPTQQIFCLTDNEDVQRKLALYRGVTAIFMQFAEKAEISFEKAVEELKSKGLVRGGQLVVLVSSSKKPIWRQASPHVAQIRQVPHDGHVSEDENV